MNIKPQDGSRLCDVSVEQLSKGFSRLDMQKPEGFLSYNKKGKITKAHLDDIHGLIPFQDGFISGSKDTSMAIWNANGKIVKRVIGKKGYEYWITALMPINDAQWISGRRNGDIAIWGADGSPVKTMVYNPSSATVCKQRNKARVNCFAKVIGQENHFYTGHPGYVKEWDGETGEIVKTYEAAPNDWVYCIEPLLNDRLIIVFGSTLQIWDKGNESLTKTTLIKEGRRRNKQQREHLSSICLLEADNSKLAAAVFDGSIRLVDLTNEATYLTYQEHIGRVWSVINLAPHIIASGADDATIKIWDVRQRQSAATLSGNPGRVSSLLRLTPERFISASCPDDPYNSTEKATISLWELNNT